MLLVVHGENLLFTVATECETVGHRKRINLEPGRSPLAWICTSHLYPQPHHLITSSHTNTIYNIYGDHLHQEKDLSSLWYICPLQFTAYSTDNSDVSRFMTGKTTAMSATRCTSRSGR
jgi:hypothetical protein